MSGVNELIDRIFELEQENSELRSMHRMDFVGPWQLLAHSLVKNPRNVLYLYISILSFIIITIFVVAPSSAYFRQVIELKRIEVESAGLELQKSRSEINLIEPTVLNPPKVPNVSTTDKVPEIAAEPSFISRAWRLLREWVLPSVIIFGLVVCVLYLIYVCAVFLLRKMNNYTASSKVKISSFFSVASSLTGSTITAVRYWKNIGNNAAIEYVFYSSVACLIFITILLVSRKLWAALGAYFVLVSALFLSSFLARGGIFDIFSEYTNLMSKGSIPSGAILLLGVIFPIVFVFITAGVFASSDNAVSEINER